MKNKHSKIIIWILAALSPILCAVTYPFLPQQVPMHWDINGTVSYEGKETFICLKLTRERKITPNFQNIMTTFACS